MQRIGFYLAGLLLLASSVAIAADVNGLYEASVSPSTDRARDSAFVEAFRMVAIKVSGTRSAGEKFPTEIPNIRNNVQLRKVLPDGSVTIRFDDAFVDKALTAAGLPIWGRERPSVLVWLSMPDTSGRAVWASADRSSPERDAMDRIATARGIPLIWPTMDATDTTTASNLSAARGSAQALLASGERYRADAVLFGTATRESSGAVTVKWSFALQGASDGASGEMQGSLEEGVEQAADRSAQLFAVLANARADVLVSVSGIHNLDAYAGAMSYLQGLTVVTNVAVEQLTTDSMQLRVAVRGDANSLRRAVELKRRVAALVLDTASSSPGDGALHFRYLQ